MSELHPCPQCGKLNDAQVAFCAGCKQALAAEIESILTEALRISGGARQENYGHPLANHVRIAHLWNGYLAAKHTDADGKEVKTALRLEPVDVVHLMILLKIARELHTSKRDNFVDIAGYARCGARIANHEP